MKRVAALFAILMIMMVPFAGAATAAKPQDPRASIITQTKLWYYLYIGGESKFHRLYNESVSAGIDNTTLQTVMQLYENASAEYKVALSYGNPLESKNIAWLPFIVHMRKAYVTLRDAISLLEDALKGLEARNA
ncbi:pyrolysin [Thermococcus sp. JdF3]|uniref:pyrolysin n=1 Tax=Thermococcus sp. JdF3 TaxID=1638258 RepID=UPI00143875B0|nr:pyrolysin [Thermococcus sp. JdF3]NJE01042.1 pyrolysin [Thermococcus sp. JdF3]